METNGDTRKTKCFACPVKCGANRSEKAGYCGVKEMRVAKYYLHPFEEPCISFSKGSGTVFFTGCNLKCVFCQNFELSRAQRGMSVSPARLADIFKELEDAGADNISLVTPSHIIAELEKTFKIYRPKIPVVYNSGGYDSVESLKRVDEYIDIYLPDLKFYSPFLSKRYTGREDYFSVSSAAVRFMARKPLRFEEPKSASAADIGAPNGRKIPSQIPSHNDAQTTPQNEAQSNAEKKKMLSGIIVRHLVMPLGVNDSFAILKWFKNELPQSACLSLMSQYTPFGEIAAFPELSRPVTAREYNAVVNRAFALDIKNLFVQKRSSAGEEYIPEWDY